MNKISNSLNINSCSVLLTLVATLSNAALGSEFLCSDASFEMTPTAKAKSGHYDISRKTFNTHPIIANQELAIYIQGYCRTSPFPKLLFNRRVCPGGLCTDWFDATYTYKKGSETASIVQRISISLERNQGYLPSYAHAKATFGDVMSLAANTYGLPEADQTPGHKFRSALYKAFPDLPNAYTFTVSRVVCRQNEGFAKTECDFIREGKSVTLSDETADTVMKVFESIHAPNISKVQGRVTRGASLIMVDIISGIMGSPLFYRENLSAIE